MTYVFDNSKHSDETVCFAGFPTAQAGCRGLHLFAEITTFAQCLDEFVYCGALDRCLVSIRSAFRHHLSANGENLAFCDIKLGAIDKFELDP